MLDWLTEIKEAEPQLPLVMKQTLKLTDSELALINMVMSRFLIERKPTARRQLVIKFEDPDLPNQLVSRGLLRDINHQNFLPTLLAFEFCGDDTALSLAKESVTTVLYALKALFLAHEEDRMFSEAEIGRQIQDMGKPLGPDTVWLGLYFADEFNVLGGWGMNEEQTARTSVRVSEWILKEKDIPNAWNNVVKQRIQWQIQRESYNPATSSLELGDDTNTFDVTSSQRDIKRVNLQLFISHSSKDHDIALSLIELLKSALALEDQEIRCTSIDGFRLPSGTNTDDVLKAEVLEANAFIGLITPNSIGSAYVLFELGARWGAKRYMVPLLAGLSPEALQGPLKGINSISSDKTAQLHQLIADLGNELNLPSQSAAVYSRYADKLAEQSRKLFSERLRNTDDGLITNGIERLAYHFRTKQTVHIFGLYNKEPEIRVLGRVALTAEQAARASFIRTQLQEEQRPEEKRPNDSHALLAEEPAWSEQELTFNVKGLDYAEILARTEHGSGEDKKIRLISSNAVIVCRESKQLILHRRASRVRSFPNCLHTVGGGYMPYGIGPKHDRSLKHTLIREVLEETTVSLAFDDIPPLLIMEELETGWIQVAHLGIAISAAQANEVHKDAS